MPVSAFVPATSDDVRLRRLQSGQHGHGSAEEERSAAAGGNVLVGAGAEAKKVAKFIVSRAEPGGRSGTFETTHGPVPAFDAAVILFQPVVEVAAGPVPNILAEFGPDSAWVAIVTVRRNPVRRAAGDCLGRAEERLGCRHVAALAEHYVHQRSGAVDGAQIAPAAIDLD